MLFGMAMYGEHRDNPLSQGYLERGSYGEDSKQYDLIVDGADEGPLPFTVEISPMQYEKDKAMEVMEELLGRLPQQILGEIRLWIRSARI